MMMISLINWPLSWVLFLLTLADGSWSVKPGPYATSESYCYRFTDRPKPVLRDILFDHNSAALTGEAKENLDANILLLQELVGCGIVKDLTVEGHCDERGSVEYNLDLGTRRARATADYLSSKKIALKDIKIVSFSELLPRDSGHSYSSWSKNRRVSFNVWIDPNNRWGW